MFALDKSMRSTDIDGRLHIAKSHISKASVNPYMGSEIPGYKELGLDPHKIYQLLRDPKELEKAAATFARLPILSKHVPVTVDAPQPDLVVGAIGSDVSYEDPYLDADLCFWDASSIAGIDTGKVKELSCAYRYVPVMEPGEFNGEPYDGVMTQIQGNHLAPVEAGRAGPDVVAADHNPFSFKEKTMKMNKTGKAMFAALCAISPTFATDAALPAIVGNISKKTFKKDEVKAKLIALDASLDSNKLDAVLDAILDTDQEPAPMQPAQKPDMPAKDASPSERVKGMLAGKVDDELIKQICEMMDKPAQDGENDDKNIDDEEPTENDKPVAAKDMQAAMDSMATALRARLMAAAEAVRDVRPTVGDVIGMDSAADVYKFALDHMKVECAGITDANALKALYKVASIKSPVAPVIAQDEGGFNKRFPAAARIRNA